MPGLWRTTSNSKLALHSHQEPQTTILQVGSFNELALFCTIFQAKVTPGHKHHIEGDGDMEVNPWH